MELSYEFPSSHLARDHFGGRTGATRAQTPDREYFSSTNDVSISDVRDECATIESFPFYDIVVKDLTYKVDVKSKEKGTTQKVLLNGVNTEAYHGQILAIVGPSGSGKTTLLDALAGRIARRSLTGEVFVNGELVDNSFKNISGYVMQDDALFPMLTVRETLLYSARLRLPSSMPFVDKEKRVDNMIIELGLKGCVDTRVGNETIRGVSGGERRRVSIGSDLIHDPAVLFLDEPTSALDSTSALNVLQILRKMAQDGKRTVVLTIHQPSYRLLDTIDRVLVLGMGFVIYDGPHKQIKHHFDPLGRAMPESVNVIEYALDTIDDYQKLAEGNHTGLSPLKSLRKASNKKAMNDIEAASTFNQAENNAADRGTAPVYATSFLSECFVLTDRTLKNTVRTPELFLGRLVLLTVTAVLVGTIFLRVKVNEKGGRQRASWFGFSLAFLLYTAIEAVGIFLEDRRIYIRETASGGAYRAGSHVMAGALVAVPSMLIQALVFSSVAYFIVGFVPDVWAFLVFVLIIWLTMCMSNSYINLISSLVPNVTVGNSLSSATSAYFLVLSGVFIPRSSIPKYWIWLHYLSLLKYPYESLLQNEFGNKMLKNAKWGNIGSSEDVLISLSVGAVHQWVNIVVMIILFLGYRVLVWLVLKYLTKSIRK